MNIGIFAGTFDPIHNGHIAFARTAISEAQLDKVIIVAEKEPYRKKPHASWDHRQAMIERATEKVEQVDHDYQFAAALAHQHTMKDMLAQAQQHYGKEHPFWFLVGSDLFEHLHQWHNLIGAEQYGGFVVALRDDHTKTWFEGQKQVLKDFTESVVIVNNPYPHVSSSKIRVDTKEGRVSTAVPQNVAEYIANHNLYL